MPARKRFSPSRLHIFKCLQNRNLQTFKNVMFYDKCYLNDAYQLSLLGRRLLLLLRILSSYLGMREMLQEIKKYFNAVYDYVGKEDLIKGN